MQIIVTGGCGFIGSNFINYALTFDQVDSIINIDRLTYAGREKNIEEWIRNSDRYQLIKEDVTKVDISPWIYDIDGIVHMAAETHVDRSIVNSTDFIQTNVVGTHNLLEQIRKSKLFVPFVYVSTDEVYGSLDLEDSTKFSEKSPFDPRSPYAASKAGADMLCKAYGHTYGMCVKITRCSNNYGKYQFPEKFIPTCIYSLMDEKPIPLYGDGLYVRDWIHVDDHCKAIMTVLKKGQVWQTYNIGANNEWSNVDIARIICSYFKKDPTSWIKYVADRPGHDRRYAIDSSKIRREFGWVATTSFIDGLYKTIRWYETNRGWWDA